MRRFGRSGCIWRKGGRFFANVFGGDFYSGLPTADFADFAGDLWAWGRLSF